MTIFVGIVRYEIDDKNCIGVGGEATVFPINNTTAIKIYKNPDIFKESKIRHMLSMSVDNTLRSFAAWPREIVTDINGKFIGFSMDRIKGSETFKSMFIERISVENRIKLAYNICALTENLHRCGIIIGDLNPGNFIIHDTNQITAIDTDSFHIITPKYEYRCVVGCTWILPAEIQEKWGKFGVLMPPCPLPTFTKYTDYFSMATLIYWLLVNSYPFSTSASPSLSSSAQFVTENELIKKRIFPPINGGNKYLPQKGSVSFSMLPKDIQEAFQKTFVYGADHPTSRVTPIEWMNILSQTLRNSPKCSYDRRHLIYHSNECPYCKADNELKAIAQKANQNLMKINNSPMTVQTPAAITPVVNNTPVFHSASTYNNANAYIHKQVYLHNTVPYLAFCLISSFVFSAFLSNLSTYIIDMFGYLDGKANDPFHIFVAIILSIIYYVRTEEEYELYGPSKWYLFLTPVLIGFFSQQICTIIVFLVVLAIIIGILAIFEIFS